MTVLTPSMKKKYARRKRAQVLQGEHVRHDRTEVREPPRRRLAQAHLGATVCRQVEERRNREDREEHHGRDPHHVHVRIDEQGGEQEPDGRAEVSHAEAQPGHPALPFARDDVGEVGVVEDERALEADVRDQVEHEAPQRHPGLERGEEQHPREARCGEQQHEALAHSAAVGDGAEQGSGDGHDQRRARHRQPPPEIPAAGVVPDDVRGIEDREHRGLDHGRVDGVREVEERPGADLLAVHDVLLRGRGTRHGSGRAPSSARAAGPAVAPVRRACDPPEKERRMNRIVGKRVLVTGASAGIGEACARLFAEKGADLVLVARREDRVAELASELAEKHGVQAHAYPLDVTDRAAVFSFVERLAEERLLPDILVNNAGKARGFDKLHEGDPDDWDDMIDTNVKGSAVHVAGDPPAHGRARRRTRDQHRQHRGALGLPEGRGLQRDEVRRVGAQRGDEHGPARYQGARIERGSRPHGDRVQRGALPRRYGARRRASTRTPRRSRARTSPTPSCTWRTCRTTWT